MLRKFREEEHLRFIEWRGIEEGRECKECGGAKAKQTNHEKEMYRLLVWADALMRSMSGWPENHPNEYIEWKEDWRKLLEGN